MQYYIKQLGHQELGSIKSNGTPSRGRYLYISKHQDVLSLFPPLSQIVFNDSALLPILSLSLNQKVYCNYIYHNDKFSEPKGTRNEYRIYLNNALEGGPCLYQENDILVFRKGQLDESNSSQEVFFLEHVTPVESDLYSFCKAQLSSSPLKGAHAIYNGTIDSIESKISNLCSSFLSVTIDTQVTNKLETQDEENRVADLFNQNSFRDFVLVGYNNTCAITGTSISWNGLINLEAAHIRPRSHGGLYLPNNGIALSRDVHWAFDKGFFTIDKNFTVVVHKEVQHTYLSNYHGKKIYLPSNTFFLPDQTNLEYHQDVVFGLFKITGRL